MSRARHLPCFNGVDAVKILNHSIASSHIGSKFQSLKIHQGLGEDEINVFLSVQILFVRPRLDMQVVVRAVVLIVIVLRNALIEGGLLVQADGGLVGPASRYVFNSVSTSS
jgi:hypothetical protein